MKQFGIVVMMVAILTVLLTAGCTSSSEKEALNTSATASNPENETRYVQINFLDGTSAGGEYVSETAAFTTIKVMYILDPDAYTRYNYSDDYVRDPDKYLIRGNGAEIGFKNALINTMTTIDNPEQFIEKTQQEVKEEADAAKKAAKKAYDDWMEKYPTETARRNAEASGVHRPSILLT